MDSSDLRDKNKGVIGEYGTWAVKCVILAIVVVVSLQAWKRLDRQNLLVDAILREFQVVNAARQQRQSVPPPVAPVPKPEQ